MSEWAPVETELKKTLEALVAIDTTSSRSNLPAIEYLEARLQQAGFQCERQSYVDERGIPKANLVGSCVPGRATAELALVGHTDCVPFDPQWSEALVLAERDGKLFGRGACDTKAFIACALTAALRASRPDASLRLFFTADEEVGCLGSKRLVDGGVAGARYAVVGEPTSLSPVVAHKGYALAEVELLGVEGHSAYPETGVPAIFHAGRFLKRLEELALTELRVEQDPRFSPPYTSVNVGQISGGKAKNVIPGSCRFTVEWRPIPLQPLDRMESIFKQVREELSREDATVRTEIRVLRKDRGVDTPLTSRLVAFLQDQSGRAPSTVPFGTEAPDLTRLGAEAVVFGPGDIRVAHRTGEFVPVAELVACEQILERAIAHFCGAPSPPPASAARP